MRRSILFLLLGTFCTAILVSAVSVYLFHDIDRDMMGRLNEAFRGLCVESMQFALLIGISVGLLTALGKRAFGLKGYCPPAKLAFLLGVTVTVLQHPWDFSARMMFPKMADLSVALYLVVAIVLCTTVLLTSAFKQKKASSPV